MRKPLARLFIPAALAAAALAAAPSTVSAEAWIAGSQWGPEPGPRPTEPRYVRFAAKGKVFIFGGCNHIRGTYAVEGDGLTITTTETTAKACTQDVMARERAFTALLASIRRVEVVNHRLVVKDAAGNKLTTLARHDWD